ncbi:MAG: DUF2239 family protein [Pseudomonadota bacterium]
MFSYTAFDGFKIISQGSLEVVALDVKRHLKAHRDARILIFSDTSGKQMDFDLSGTEKEVLERLKIFKPQEPPVQPSGPGRPKLGVITREIALLPHQWEWLSNQTGGSSVALRRLVDEKINSGTLGKDKVKQMQEAAYSFLSAIAGDFPNFEEAIRFLYRRDKKKFKELISTWPNDVATHAMALANTSFTTEKK